MKYFITHHLNSEEKEKYTKEGLFVYDLRDDDFGEDIASIEKNVLVNRIGSIITDEEIIFSDKPEEQYYEYLPFIKKNICVQDINDLLRKDKQKTKDEKHKSKDWRER